MKKVLFATTALVFSAGIASAEMTLSGSAEMGITGGDRYGDDDASFHNDFTLKFVGSGETDNGLTFGLLIELEESNGARAINGGTELDNEAVFISGNFGTLTMGEIDGAYDKRLTEVALAGGTIADDETEHAGFNGNSGLDGNEDNQILRYDYEFGDFGFSVSMEQDNNGVDSDDIYAVGLGWGGEFTGVEVGVGFGYQTQDNAADFVAMSLTGDFGNGFEAALNYTMIDDDGAFGDDGQHIGIGAAYTLDAWTFAANYGSYDWDSNGPADADGFGLLVNYDLGGGAVIQAGYGDGENIESWSLGVAMSF